MEYLRQSIKETKEMKIEIDYNGAFAVCNIELMEEPGKIVNFNDANGKSRLGCTVAAKFSRQFSDEVSWQKVDPQAAAAASGEEDITEGGDNQGGGGNTPPSGELEG